MPYGRITPKQQEILDYIKNEILNRGFPPAVREICEAVNLKSTSSVHSHLEALEKNGYIRRDATKPRAIEIIDDNFNLVRREVVNVPIIGTVAAGQPLLAVENIEGYFPIPAEFMPNSQSFLLKVKGESMINAGIFDGDQVLVKQQSTAEDGDIVVALIDDGSIKKKDTIVSSRKMIQWSQSLYMKVFRFLAKYLVCSVCMNNNATDMQIRKITEEIRYRLMMISDFLCILFYKFSSYFSRNSLTSRTLPSLQILSRS